MRDVFIQEVTSVNPNITIVKESFARNGAKVVFNARVQTCNEVNSNGRYYEKKDIEEAISKIYQKVKSRTLLGELDHPLDDSNLKRQVTVSLKEAAHIITDIWFEDTDIYATCETLDTPNGTILAALIRDKVPVGFSLRAFGRLESKGNITYVKPPIYIVTYDAVHNPSHTRAYVTEVVSESLVLCANGKCVDTRAAQEYLFERALRKELTSLKQLIK